MQQGRRLPTCDPSSSRELMLPTLPLLCLKRYSMLSDVEEVESAGTSPMDSCRFQVDATERDLLKLVISSGMEL